VVLWQYRLVRENDRRKLDDATLGAIRIRAVKEVESGARVDDVAAGLLPDTVIHSRAASSVENASDRDRRCPVAGSTLSGSRTRPWHTTSVSGRGFVLVEQATEDWTAPDPGRGWLGDRRSRTRWV
jgi:hypothetical protein